MRISECNVVNELRCNGVVVSEREGNIVIMSVNCMYNTSDQIDYAVQCL